MDIPQLHKVVPLKTLCTKMLVQLTAVEPATPLIGIKYPETNQNDPVIFLEDLKCHMLC